MNNLLLAIGVGFIYWLGYCEFQWSQMIFKEPIAIGALVGLMMGDFQKGIMLGGSLQLLYIAGSVAPGSNISSDGALATCIAVPVALASGLDSETAIMFAVPFGILGVFLDNFRRTVMGYWTRRGDKHAAEGNTRALLFDGIVGPCLFNIPIRWIPVAVIVYLGPSAAEFIVEAMPAWLSNGLAVAGGMLPAVGLALILQVLNNKIVVLYFLLGAILFQVLDMTIMTAAALGGIIAFLHIMFTKKDNQKVSA